MFRKMRRSAQLLSREMCERMLARGTSGVLAVLGDGGYPYAVPLSYAYRDGSIYFHCARSGHKLDALARCDRASFCVIDRDVVIPERYTTQYLSVIAFGRARALTDVQQVRRALELLAEKYAPDDPTRGRDEMARDLERVCVVELRIEHMTGKAGLEALSLVPPDSSR